MPQISAYVFLIYVNFVSFLFGLKLDVKELGTLVGSTTQTAWTQQEVFQFLGIPFAKAPSGALRFKPPVPAELNLGVRNVQNHGRPCPVLKYIGKMTTDELEGDLEDCLHISVYTKDVNRNSPVMFFIHGGAFEEGAAFQFPPNYLLEKDVVLVVPQYRLGPFGFLSTQSDEIPGSAALLDLILALKWTSKYIESFGGDPTCITIFGHSAGGALASALLLSPEVPSNLFHRVIIQSGSMLSTRAFDMNPYRNAKDMAQHYCDGPDSLEEVNDCLMNMDVIDLLKSYHMHARKQKLLFGVHEFGGAKLTFNSILPKEPNELIHEPGAIKNIPLMAGVTKHEGTFILAMVEEYLRENYGPSYLELNIYEHLDEIVGFLGLREQTGVLVGLMANNFFTKQQLIQGTVKDTISALIGVSGSITLKAPLFKIAQTQAMHYPHQTFLYSLDYQSNFPYLEDMSFFANCTGVHHYTDIRYLFPFTLFGPIDNYYDMQMAIKMVNLWTSFAEFGAPRTDDALKWPPLSNKIGPYFHIDNETSIGTNFLVEYSAASNEEYHLQNNNQIDVMWYLVLLIILIILLKK